MTTIKKLKRKTREQLVLELNEANKRAAQYYDERSAALTSAKRAEERECKIREQFGDLKLKLLDSEREVSNLRGYLARVHEDDIVRDGMIEIEDANGKRMIPKRPPPLQSYSPPMTEQYGRPAGLYAGMELARKHWTDY